jgi:hypothetical protein
MGLSLPIAGEMPYTSLAVETSRRVLGMRIVEVIRRSLAWD